MAGSTRDYSRKSVFQLIEEERAHCGLEFEYKMWLSDRVWETNIG